MTWVAEARQTADNAHMLRKNTAAFVHDPPLGALERRGDSNYVRVQVPTNAGARDRGKQLAVVQQFTDWVASAAGDASLTNRTWVLLTEAIEGGWGLAGHANTKRGAHRNPPGQTLPNSSAQKAAG